MPSAPRFVRVTSFRPSKGSELWFSHDLTPFRDALQVFFASLRNPARRYGYRGLKIFTSLALRFQDFQRRSKTALKTELGSGWSATAAFQFMSGQQAKAVLEYGLPEEQLPMLTAHLIAKEVCAEYGLGAVNKPDQVDRAQLLALVGARQNRIQ